MEEINYTTQSVGAFNVLHRHARQRHNHTDVEAEQRVQTISDATSGKDKRCIHLLIVKKRKTLKEMLSALNKNPQTCQCGAASYWQ